MQNQPVKHPSEMTYGELHLMPIARVAELACANFGVTKWQFYGECRYRIVSKARWAASWICYQLGKSSVQIGRQFNIDHSSILHGIRRAEQLRQSDEAFRIVTDRILEKVKQ